jgi:hypothetical protein
MQMHGLQSYPPGKIVRREDMRFRSTLLLLKETLLLLQSRLQPVDTLAALLSAQILQTPRSATSLRSRRNCHDAAAKDATRKRDRCRGRAC